MRGTLSSAIPCSAVVILALLLAGCGDDRRGIPITYRGIDHVDRSDLEAGARRELKDFQEQGHTASALADSAYAMEDVLREQGFAHARVDFTMEPSEAEVHLVVITVKEGPRAYLRALRFPGAVHFTQRRLRGTLKAQGIGFFNFWDAPLRRRDLDSCASRVEELYLYEGFYRVKVTKPVLSWTPDKRRADVDIVVTEGRRFYVASTRIEADLTDSGLGEEALAPVRPLGDVEGQPYHVRLPSHAAARIRSWFLQRGHLDVEVVTSAEVDDEAATVSVLYRITPGPVYVLDEVVAIGLDRTKPGFVEKRLGLKSGAPIDRDRLDKGIRALSRSGAFSSVRWDKRPEVDVGDRRPADIVLNVSEARARSLDFELGFGSYELARGGIRYRDRNLFGQGRFWELHPTASMRSYGIASRIRDDYLVGANNTLELGGSYLYRREPAFDRRTATGLVTLEHRFGQLWSTKGGYIYETTKAFAIRGAIPDAERTGFVSSARVFDGLRFDCRDSVVEPSTGALANVGIAYSAPLVGSDVNFLEYSASTAYFLHPLQRLVLAADARYTTRQVFQEATLPIQERLFLGGESSVRSYRQDQLSPRDAAGNATGGLTATMATFESRFQLKGHLWSAAFYDVGSVAPDTWSLDGTRGQAIGVGLRYHLPVGPVRFDVAYDPDKKARKFASYLFMLAVGFTF
ncbi:MAG: BamA/TamA family outer membrane protein [Planctomycetes bacterium]|nr:BamA/TamA family outer membrane protein [Planctomycetota bacterium]